MYKEKIEQLLLAVKNQQMAVGEALHYLQNLPYEDLGFANLDHHRMLRKGFPEVVFCQNKQTEQASKIICRLAQENDVLATRATREIFDRVRETMTHAEYNELARTVVIQHR
ncbi:1-(5-phosphoribosyl)-5-amino-4-imidazole-carboxylate carboxylase, partial [candidate division KSB1 bacterium]|nr:1-(5-phosphoribosyl)-5-amino-4-imidazole-carboxylate carboxylase [candidate division KSB1 bacterium]